MGNHFCFFCWIDKIIQLRCYKFMINLFYFTNRFLELNIYWFYQYHSKEGKFFLIGICSYNLIFFLENIDSLYDSYQPIIYIIFCIIFQTCDSTLTLCFYWNRRSSSHKWKGQSSFLVVSLIHWYDNIVIYFWLTYYISSIIFLNTISTDFLISQQRR